MPSPVKSLKSGERGETESLFLVFLGQEPAGPIPTARPHLLSLPRTRPAATLGLGLRCLVVKRRRVPERQPDLGPLPLTQSRTRQSRIPKHICQSGCWPVGLWRASCLLRGENPSVPVFWPGETCGGCWTGRGRRATSRCLTVAIPSWVRSGGGGARRISARPQGAAMAGGGILPRASARQSKGLAMVSSRATRPNSLFCSPHTHTHAHLPPPPPALLRGADLRPPLASGDEGAPWLLPPPPLFVPLSREVCAAS